MDAFLPYIQQLIANLFGNTGDVAGAASKVVGGLDMAGLVALAASPGLGQWHSFVFGCFYHWRSRHVGLVTITNRFARVATPSDVVSKRLHVVC